MGKNNLNKSRHRPLCSSKSDADYVTRRFDASSARLKNSLGWTFAETPPNAISRSNWSPESAELRPLCKAPREDGSRFPRRNWIAAKQSTIRSSKRDENKKYDNCTFKKINWSVAFAARFT